MSKNIIFNHLVQKVINKNNEIYNFELNQPISSVKINTEEDDKILKGLTQQDDKYKRFEEFTKKELNSENANMSLIKRFFYDYLRQLQTKPKFSKFMFFSKTLDNIFLTTEQKTTFLEIFVKIQRLYYAFVRIAYMYKFKKAPLQITTDLFMNNLSSNQKNVFTLFQNNSKYLFTITDLNNSMLTSLCHHIQYFSYPQSCKNPYNNVPFNKSTLYNIYFFIKFRNYNVPKILENYFKSNFNLQKFKMENESLMREYVIKNSVYSSPNHELYDDILEMLSAYKCRGKTLHIHESFPINKLVEVMRPYLHLYYKTKFSLDSYQRFDASEILYKKLVRFINFNPNFGKRYSKLVQVGFNKKKFNTLFYDVHVNFYEDEYNNFENSHLNQEDSDSESSQENDENDEIVNDILGNDVIMNNIFYNDEHVSNDENVSNDEDEHISNDVI